jgi:hypothetical protein
MDYDRFFDWVFECPRMKAVLTRFAIFVDR